MWRRRRGKERESDKMGDVNTSDHVWSLKVTALCGLVKEEKERKKKELVLRNSVR